MKISIHSITIRATIVDEDNLFNPKDFQRTFTPDEQGLPGLITDMFSNAKRFLFHNVQQKLPSPPSRQQSIGERRVDDSTRRGVRHE